MNGRAQTWLILLFIVAAASKELACAGAGSLLPPPDTSDLESGNWRELRSPDFVLYSQGSKEKIEAFATDLSRFVAVTERLVQGQRPKTTARIFVVDPAGAALFIRSARVGAFMHHGLGGFDGVVPAADHDPIHRHLFLHEFSHYLNLRNTRLAYPKWYVEGFAEFLGSTRSRDDVVELGSVPPGRLYELSLRKARGDAIDLAEIFAYERNSEERMPDDFYSVSWATVHYFNASAENRKRLSAMLELQGSGVEWRRALARCFPDSVDELSAKVERHVEILSTGAVGSLAYLPLESLSVRTDWTHRDVPPEEVMQLLAELAARGAVWGREGYSRRLAEGLYARALDLDPEDSRTNAGLARLLASRERFDAAKTRLAVFEADPSPSPEALVAAGEAIQLEAFGLKGMDETVESRRRALYTSAETLFRRALESRASDPLALAGLGRSQLATERFDLARESLAKAQENGEWNAGLTLDRGRVEAAAGFPDRARRYWKEVVRLGSPEDAERARALLVELGSSM